jgi:hypothetical protein
MIVKNEAHVLARCLDSVKPFVTAWVIVDTGSTDATQDLVRSCMRGIPGELHERPWKDFGHNRTEAIVLARGKAEHGHASRGTATVPCSRSAMENACRPSSLSNAREAFVSDGTDADRKGQSKRPREVDHQPLEGVVSAAASNHPEETTCHMIRTWKGSFTERSVRSTGSMPGACSSRAVPIAAGRWIAPTTRASREASSGTRRRNIRSG